MKNGLEAQPLILVAGASGQHATVVYEAAILSGMMVAGYVTVDDSASLTVLDCKQLGRMEEILVPSRLHDHSFVVACGSNKLRRDISEQLSRSGAEFQTVCHPSAIVSPSALISPGSMLLAGSIIGPRASIGRGVIVNHAASIGHDCIVGDYSNICSGARLAGATRLGASVFIGLNASILQGCEVGQSATIGAGAVVTRDVIQGSVMVGVPAKALRKHDHNSGAPDATGK
jgi:sugar O-acyltransferase (sialic acid O-acetyltransferase NeuD family)